MKNKPTSKIVEGAKAKERALERQKRLGTLIEAGAPLIIIQDEFKALQNEYIEFLKLAKDL
jgi:DNA-directed RNA polymerase beta' subunit